MDSVRTCSRCRQPLAEGTSYCVACGCASDVAFEKMIANEDKIEERRVWLKFWISLANRYPILHWFS